MQFIETPIFTRSIVDLMDDRDYWSMQVGLFLQPQLGRVIPGSGGLRKLRWSMEGMGKRGGIRVIYYWDRPSDTIYMLYAYRKNRQEDLSAQQLRQLDRLVREEFG